MTRWTLFRKKSYVYGGVDRVPDDYEFSKEYTYTVEYAPEEGFGGFFWKATLHDFEDRYARKVRYWGRTKEEAIAVAQNCIYDYDLEQKTKADNPPEILTVPPVRRY